MSGENVANCRTVEKQQKFAAVRLKLNETQLRELRSTERQKLDASAAPARRDAGFERPAANG
jgi:hypothetical protein